LVEVILPLPTAEKAVLAVICSLLLSLLLYRDLPQAFHA
jgi:hypothetical protein